MMIDRQMHKAFASEAQHYIYVQTKASTADGEGGFLESWSNSGPIPAAISPIQARQQFDYKSIGVDATHLIRVRGYTEISEADRVLFGSRIFEVLTVEDIRERSFVKVITCREVR